MNNVLNSPVLKFKESEGEMVLETDLNSGCKVALNASGFPYGSIGFRAKRNSDGKIEIVTAGHVIGVGQTLFHGGTAVGTCSAPQISGKIDAAFVPIIDPAAYVPTNKLCGATTDLLSTVTAQPGLLTLVNKRGATTGHTTGRITNTNTTDLVKSCFLSPNRSMMKKNGVIAFFKQKRLCCTLALVISLSCSSGTNKLESTIETPGQPIPKEMEQKTDRTVLDILMEIRPDTFNSEEEKSAIYTIRNNSFKALNFGSECRIERFEHDKWRNVPLVVGVEDILYGVDKRMIVEFPLRISLAMGRLQERVKGRYRICKDVWEEGKEDEKTMLDTVFTIE